MTEAEWLASIDVSAMLRHLEGRLSERKLRAFACAGARSAWHLLGDARSREAVEVVERSLDAPEPAGDRARAEALAERAQFEVWQAGGGSAGSPVRTPEWSAALFAYWAAKHILDLGHYYLTNGECMRAAPPLARQAALLRDVTVGLPPAEAPTSDRRGEWATATVLSLAAAAYEERAQSSGELDPARLAVLADALEEARCDQVAILRHLRGPGPHVRGCWALDLVLGRS